MSEQGNEGAERLFFDEHQRSTIEAAMSRIIPTEVDVCIIGAGASEATAAQVLTENGVNVVALEHGPWRTKESFGGDELANVNRYNLWPDPLLNPRTYHGSEDEEPHEALCCPVLQMVCGGTVHWQGWLSLPADADDALRAEIQPAADRARSDHYSGRRPRSSWYTRLRHQPHVFGGRPRPRA